MTSNKGSNIISKEKNITKDKILEILKNNFRPDFINRIDEIITFRRLIKEDIGKIIDIQLNILSERLKK